MEWAGKSLMELDSSNAGARVSWADIAKAFSIILLVIWSLYGLSLYFDQMFILARMPMFFFVSGLFAHRVITRSEPLAFVRDKVGNLLYLYALWTLIWFASTELVAWLWWGREIEARPFAMLWSPVIEMWFFYGLALTFGIAYLCRRLPVWAVFASAMVLYFTAVATGDWLAIPFVEKVVRLFPYFWLGLVLRPLVWQLVEVHWRLWPLAGAAFLALAYWVMDSPWQRFGPLTFAISAIGIFALLSLAAQVSQFEWSWILKLIGGSTLYIYATQHITIFYLDRLFGVTGALPYEKIVMLPIIVLLGTLFGRWCAGRAGFRWLFAAPWSPRKAPAAVAVPVVVVPTAQAGARRREA